MDIRLVEPSDADGFLSLVKQLDNETPFMLYEPGERTTSVDQQRKIFENLKNKETSNIFVVENHAGRLVGFIGAFGGGLQRNRHSGYVVIGIIEQYQGKGIGKNLFKTMEAWAAKQKIERLDLTVMKHNIYALNLYLKMGYEIEGVKRSSLKINGKYVDEYYLSKIMI